MIFEGFSNLNDSMFPQEDDEHKEEMEDGMRAVTACAPWKAAFSSHRLGSSLPGDRSCGGSSVG